MRILFLADAVFNDLAGGSRMVARELARELMERGHEVTFLVARVKPDAPLHDTVEGARVVRYEGAGQGSQLYPFRACCGCRALGGAAVRCCSFSFCLCSIGSPAGNTEG